MTSSSNDHLNDHQMITKWPLLLPLPKGCLGSLARVICWNKTRLFDFSDPFLDTGDDAKTCPKHPQLFLEQHNFMLDPGLLWNMSGTCPKSVSYLVLSYLTVNAPDKVIGEFQRVPFHVLRFSVLGPRSSVLDPWSLILGPWSSVLGPWSSVLVLGPSWCS